MHAEEGILTRGEQAVHSILGFGHSCNLRRRPADSAGIATSTHRQPGWKGGIASSVAPTLRELKGSHAGHGRRVSWRTTRVRIPWRAKWARTVERRASMSSHSASRSSLRSRYARASGVCAGGTRWRPSHRAGKMWAAAKAACQRSKSGHAKSGALVAVVARSVNLR